MLHEIAGRGCPVDRVRVNKARLARVLAALGVNDSAVLRRMSPSDGVMYTFPFSEGTTTDCMTEEWQS